MSKSRRAPKPTHVAGTWAAVRLGEEQTCSITSGTPTQVGSATTWDYVTAGFTHACAHRLSGGLWCWGLNADGQFGDGTTTNRTSPTQIGPPPTPPTQAERSQRAKQDGAASQEEHLRPNSAARAAVLSCCTADVLHAERRYTRP